jgi:TrmH family RNA methyltransferase
MLQRSRLKYIQSLCHKKFRDPADEFIVEGPKMVEELLRNRPDLVSGVYGTEEWLSENKNDLKIIDAARVDMVTPEQLDSMSCLRTPREVMALVKKMRYPETPVLKGSVTLVLDAIRDPGNFGTIIRTADWFGVKQIICSQDCADIYNPKVVQATMGSIFRVDVHHLDLVPFIGGIEGFPVLCAALEGEDVCTAAKLSEGLLVIGNEGRGISDALMAMATGRITIPRSGGAESLNAAVATGILLSHLIASPDAK